MWSACGSESYQMTSLNLRKSQIMEFSMIICYTEAEIFVNKSIYHIPVITRWNTFSIVYATFVCSIFDDDTYICEVFVCLCVRVSVCVMLRCVYVNMCESLVNYQGQWFFAPIKHR